MNFERNTFFLNVKTDPKDRVEVEIGDSKQDDFHPQVKIKRWDNEVNTSFRYVHDEKNPVVVEEDGKVKWKGKDTEAHFYELEDGYEFEVILKKKPASNVVQFTLNTKGLDFFYQPELTDEEKEKGIERPENVIGSYAVYSSEDKANIVGGKDYKCGKVGHIYRPDIIDADGVKVWGELSIDGDMLSVTVPQEFLDSARYPVIVDPTFGYTSAGASFVTIASNNSDTSIRNGGVYTGALGRLDKITASLKAITASATLDMTAFLNKKNSAGPDSHDEVAKIQRISVAVSTSTAAYDFTAASQPVYAESYIISIVGDGNDLPTVNQDVQIAADNTGGFIYTENKNGATSYTTNQENPWTSAENVGFENKWKVSIYATYTEVVLSSSNFYLKQGWQ